jgi:hypothetical protein
MVIQQNTADSAVHEAGEFTVVAAAVTGLDSKVIQKDIKKRKILADRLSRQSP